MTVATSLDPKTIAGLRALSMEDAIRYWDALEQVGREQNRLLAVVRALCQADLFYLLVRACKRVDMLNEFAFARCREVEAAPDGRVDLWAREHFKSSVITFGLTIQDILKDPNITFGIFSHTRPIAKAFLRQIMREFEENETLHQAFPDVLWGRDLRAAPKWSEDEGIIVKRSQNPKEATIEAWGLVDGQPTSKHFAVLLYDDVVVQASVTTPEQIEKTMTALEQSYNLGVTPGGRRRMAGTRWHFNDAHRTVVDRGTFIPREHPGRLGGTEEGESVYWSNEIHEQKRRDMGPYTYAAQILMNPKADAMQGFKREWLRHYKKMTPDSVKKMTGYILVDAASSKKRGSDYTSMWVIGLGVDKNRYALDMVRDRLNLKERADRLFSLHRKWSEMGLRIQKVRYERYGMMADIEHIEARMEAENYRFPIAEVGGATSKADRIKRLLPIFEQSQMWLPESLYITDWQKNPVNLVQSFIEEEYMAFPVGLHDDMLDGLARMEEPDHTLVWPKAQKREEAPPRNAGGATVASWMAA
jgi:phage terminase large subunit-like protein